MSETTETPNGKDASPMQPPVPPAGPETPTIKIADEMRGAYLDYAMSVIIGRALPDVRDGLKPVHRRVLYAMYDLNNTHEKPYKKSARVVGDVIGKYHPHGDTAVYDAIVRMAQDFSLRHPLVDGQGNFGSIDGDSPAAMRYTEVRMEKITDDLLADLEKETVDFGPNYDDTLTEPLVMPARFPNLLVNGSTGIAVGMATNIPPHNLGEIIDATLEIIEDPDVSIDQLLTHVKGPDFPTSGIVFSGAGLQKAYRTGKGIITIRGRAEIETLPTNRERIIVSELPYAVNKARLMEKIAELVRGKKIEGISDLRDESDRTGMRIVIDIKKDESSTIILNRLYKLTQLQDSFGISLLAIHENQPQVFNLKSMLEAFIGHRKDVILRRTAFDLRKAQARAHILEGLKRAVENLDPIIKLIRAAQGPAEAKKGLIEQFEFTELQAQAILDMKLQRLTGLERDKIVEDYNRVISLIADLKDILGDEKRVFEIVRTELREIRDQSANPRRTEITPEAADIFDVKDLIADEETLVTVTHRGYIRRMDPSAFKVQNRGGKGIQGTKKKKKEEEDFVAKMYNTTLHSDLLCFTDQGRMYRLKVYKIPEVSRTSRGKAIVNLISLTPGEKIVEISAVKDFTDQLNLLLVTKKAVVKRVLLSQFKNFRSAGTQAISIRPGDGLLAAKVTDGKKEAFFCSRDGKSIRFPEAEVRVMGRTAAGVTGMTLEGDDQVVALEVLDPSESDAEIMLVTEKGFGKRTKISEYRCTRRSAKGIGTMKIESRNGRVVACAQVQPEDEIMIVSSFGKMIRIKVDGVSEQGRMTMGVRLMSVEDGESVVAVEHIAD